jgi:hypothetical protein
MAPEKYDDNDPCGDASLNPRKPPDGRHPPPRKKQYFTFEQVGDRAHKNAAFEPAWLLSV